MFKCFVRDWWIDTGNPAWPGGLEPGPGRKFSRRAWKFETETAAREFCQQYNAAHDPGRLSRKMEFGEIGRDIEC